MKLEEARLLIEKTLNEEAEKFDFADIKLECEISYQNDVGENCGADDKKMCFITGDILVTHSELSNDEKLTFSLLFYCKRGKIKDEDTEKEIEDFRAELAAFRDELAKSQCPSEFIRALITLTNEQNEEFTKEFQAQIAKIDKNLRIMTYSVIAVAVIGLIAVILKALL